MEDLLWRREILWKQSNIHQIAQSIFSLVEHLMLL